MMSRNPQVDAYIAEAAPFARPILEHLREQVHAACPQVEESIKWGFPNFGHKGMLCSMAAFKAHCAFGFWKQARIVGEQAVGHESAMGQFGRLTCLDDLPGEKRLRTLIAHAVAINDAAETAPKKPRPAPKPPAETPDDLAAALKKNTVARKVFEAFSTTNKREYIEWLTEAKTTATREKRLTQAIEWIAEGKPRNWKYMRK